MPVKKSSAEKGQELIKVFDIQHVPAYLNSSPIDPPKNVVPLQDTSSHHTARNKLILSSNSVQPTKMPNHPVYTPDHGAFIPVQDRRSFIFIASLSSTCHQDIPSLHPTSLSQSIFFLNGRINGLPRILCIQKKPPKIPFLTQHVVRKPL